MENYIFEKRQKEMKQQFFVFFGLVFFTIISFTLVAFFPSDMSVLFILLLAVIQVAFQLLYFMHMKDKIQSMIPFMMWSSAFVAILILCGLVLLT